MPLLDVRADHLELVKKILAAQVPHADVWAFGSRAKWLARDTSDLDLCVDAKAPLSFTQLGLLREAFENSDLPYKVDVVDWATTSESFRKIIERDHVDLSVGAWSSVPLSSLVSDGRSISYGVVQPGTHQLDGVPIIRVTDIRNGKIATHSPLRISPDIEKSHSRTRLHGGELLLTLVGTVGEMAIVPSQLAGWNVARAVAVIAVKEEVGAYWVKLALEAPAVKEMIHGRMNTTVQSTLNLKDVDCLPVLMPPPNDRHLIETVVSALDDKIELNRRINQTLEAMAQALFQSWFVDFDPVKAKIAALAQGHDPQRAAMSAISGLTDAQLDALPTEQHQALAATASLFPDGLDETGSEDVPAGWSTTTLQQLTAKIGSGSTPRGGSEVYLDEGVALIRSQNVYDAEFVWDGLARISDEAADKLKGVEVLPEDVLLNITGASILRTCVVPPAALPARVNQHVAIVRAKAGIPARYLHLHLLRPATKDYLIGLNAGGSREAVTKAHIESAPIVRPTAGVLAAFRQLTDAIYRQIETLSAQRIDLAALRDTLLPRLLSGELKVPQRLAVPVADTVS